MEVTVSKEVVEGYLFCVKGYWTIDDNVVVGKTYSYEYVDLSYVTSTVNLFWVDIFKFTRSSTTFTR